jgi:DNA helicase-2/ATP-dependent DNA helicase PcrA
VEHFGSPLLILAGAGSGKTRVITTKIAHLVESGRIPPRSILAVTFTNKAAQEMRERTHALSERTTEVAFRTFHSFGAWMLRVFAREAGLSPRFRIYDDDDTVRLLARITESPEPDAPPSVRRPWSTPELRGLAGRIARAKDLCEGPEAEQAEAVRWLYGRYESRLRTCGAADFGDLIVLPVRLMRQDARIRERLRARFRAILVDEYQDSNRAQFELLKELKGEGCYLCVVGDDDQSIYKFRGAVVENILGFESAFPGTDVIRLERNYRSTQSILDVADAVVTQNRSRLGKSLVADRPGGEPVTLRVLEDQEAEARFVADLVRDGTSTAVLYRMNHQSRVFEGALTRAGVRYALVGTVRFFERAEIKDVAAYLTLLTNPRDEIAYLRAVNHPARGVGKRTRERVLGARDACGGDLIAATRQVAPDLPRTARAGLTAFLGVLEEASSAVEALPLDRLVDRLLASSGLLDYYRAVDDSGARDETGGRVANLQELVSFCAGRTGGLDGVCALLEEAALDGGSSTAQAPQVTLITLHATKGLEFDRVVITGLEDGIFPMVREGATDVEEERRLFYVGITRARHRLYLTTCRRRVMYGRSATQEPSRFLAEIPTELLVGDLPGAGGADDGFPVGCAVYHDDYGRGLLAEKWESRQGGATPETVVVVRFETGKAVRFILRFTRLERIAQDDP